MLRKVVFRLHPIVDIHDAQRGHLSARFWSTMCTTMGPTRGIRHYQHSWYSRIREVSAQKAEHGQNRKSPFSETHRRRATISSTPWFIVGFHTFGPSLSALFSDSGTYESSTFCTFCRKEHIQAAGTGLLDQQW